MKWTSRLFRAVVAGVVITAAWWAFVTLVEGPKFEAEPVLVMVWLSALTAFLALEPDLMNAIKGVKIGELVEVELRETIEKSTYEDYTSLADLAPDEDQGIFAEKTRLEALILLLERVRAKPGKTGAACRQSPGRRLYIEVCAFYLRLFSAPDCFICDRCIRRDTACPGRRDC